MRTIRILLTIFLLAPLPVFAQTVHIPDPNLRAAISEELDGAPITRETMLQLTELDARERGITDISGLEYAHNLKSLTLVYNNISDLTPISALRLNDLWLWDNLVADLSPLANMTTLTHLDLGFNRISDISPLEKLTRLKWLELSGNQITDITALSNLTQLTLLEAFENNITDVTPLAGLTRLEHLKLQDNQITDVTPLAALTRLDRLEIELNAIADHTPLHHLSLNEFTFDQTCSMPSLPLEPRLKNRTFPSLASTWGSTATNQPHLTYYEKKAPYDLYFHALGMFDLDLAKLDDGWVVRGNLKGGILERDNLIKHNPNMIFLASIGAVWEGLRAFPDDSSAWLRDAEGRIKEAWDDAGLLDFNDPLAQKYIIDRTVAVAECGLYDGVFFDGWHDATFERLNLFQGMEDILKAIRERVHPGFLILVNAGRARTPLSAPYINGIFSEPGILDFYNYPEQSRNHFGIDISDTRLNELADALSWTDDNLKPPQINLLETDGLFNEPVDSPANRRWMRVTTTLGLTRSNGYVLFNVYNHAFEHYWYDFWDADLGRPIGEKSTLYDDEIPGLYIREYTNGWAVYNHSGAPQVVTLPEKAQGVASGLVNTEHALPNLDGEIYLRSTERTVRAIENPADINGDGIVNILDLTLVARGFGTGDLTADVNGDGVVNVFDLVFVAGEF